MLTITSPDVEEVEEMVPGMPLRVTRLRAGDRTTTLRLAQVGSVSLMAGRFEFPLHSEGEAAPDCLLMGFPTGPGEGSWNGRQLAPERAWVYGPGTEHQGAALHPPTFAAITVPRTSLPDGTDTVAASPLVLNDPAVEDLKRLTAEAFDVSLDGLVPPARAARAERDLLAAVEGLVRHGVSPELESTTAHRIVRRCVALADDIDPMPSARELSEAAGVSDRWVRAAFSRLYGVSVSSFFRARALHGARRDLLSGGPTSVTDVAMRWGFWHPGRFAGSYRRHFGELPSETIARSA